MSHLSSTDFIWPRYIIFQVHLITQVHFSSANLQYKQQS